MGLANMLDISDRSQFSIDWEITPTTTFTMFESWGGSTAKEFVITTRSSTISMSMPGNPRQPFI